jgi:hypothetical protein
LSGEREKARQEFEGRTIRARGKITRDPRGGWHIEMHSAKQITTVGR